MKIQSILKVSALCAAITLASCGPKKNMDNNKMGDKEMMKDDGMMENEKTVMVGGAAMYPSKNIVENAVNSKDHTTLVAAVTAAGLVETLQGEGPFTVFAPTNAAFDKLPKGTVATLVMPENKAKLQSILTYHVVAGKFSAKNIIDAINKNNGSFTVDTVNGEQLTATLKNGKVILTDQKGQTSTVTIADVNQSNGVIHVVDTVLLPA
ncbi:fasciclin domain-containing protein [Nonlabens antarcticus]|uniref:fasciclin domain-containing protein n=1 Tax=Nonlabens antarcticus TaxID=392714 RepID=UPI001891DC0A